MYTQVTGQKFYLLQDVDANVTYATLDFECPEAPLLTEGVMKINTGAQSEWFVFTAFSQVSGTTYRATISARGLKKDATSFSDTDTSLQKSHSTTTQATFVTHSLVWNEKVQQSGNNTFSGANTVTGSMSFTGTSAAGLIPQSVTTTQRDALTGVDDGQYLYNTTTATGQYLNEAGTWTSLATGATNSNATETDSGKVGLGTVANQQSAAQDTKVVQTRYLQHTPSTIQSQDAGRIAILDSTGRLNRLFPALGSSKFGGDGSDGAATSGTLIIAGDGYVVKNYTRISGPTSIQFSGTEVIAHIKVVGDCDLTNCTIDLKGKGGAGGAGGTINLNGAPNNGTVGSGAGTQGLSTLIQSAISTGGGGALSSSVNAAGTGGSSIGVNLNFAQTSRMIVVHTGNGGAGGGGGYNDSATGGSFTFESGGVGGRGGGVLILEVGGNLNMTGATVDVRGNDGLPGVVGTSQYNGGGGGGGGAGGCVVVLYNGTLTGSPTTLLTGGAGGAGGGDVGSAGWSGSGGGGGTSAGTAGGTGSTGTATSGGGAGGTGATGVSLYAQNGVWA